MLIHDNNKIWNILNNLIYNEDVKNSIKIQKICENNETVMDQQEIANILNDYFVNVIEQSTNIRMPENILMKS